MAASLDFPFTNAQWNELHRQAMIYKYMMASVPVPPGLLFLDPAASCSPWVVRGGEFSLRVSSSTDPESGRCRRTDGKKWRCSRDAAPDKKYCERHMNRGRPRSRKPVELVHLTDRNKKARHSQNNLPVGSFSVANSPSSGTACQGIKINDKAVAFSSAAITPSHQDSRSMNWGMKEPAFMGTADQEWQHMIKLRIGSPEISFSYMNTSALHQDRQEEDPLILNNCTHFVCNKDELNKCNYLDLDMVYSQKVQTNTPRGFIDAWSNSVSDDKNITNTNMDHSVHLSNEATPLSSLTLSMGGGSDSLDMNTADDKERNGLELDFSGWLSSAPAWALTTPGGPLAEVLRPPTSTVSNGDSSSAIVTGVSISSPSGGAVQKATVVSFSDSSGASSPTTLGSSSHARTETAMQCWGQP